MKSSWDTVMKQVEACKTAIAIISTPVLRFMLVILNAFFKNPCIIPILQMWKEMALGQVPCLNKTGGVRRPCSCMQRRKGQEWGLHFQQQASHRAAPIATFSYGKRTWPTSSHHQSTDIRLKVEKNIT